MTASERLERMLKLAEEREARGELVATPEEVKAKEEARNPSVCKFSAPKGEFIPVRDHKLKHQKPPQPKTSRWDRAKKEASKKPKRKKGSCRYIATAKKLDHWKALKAQVLQTRGEKCECCGGETNKLWLTHVSWKRKGRELPEDVELLCFDCFKAKKETPGWWGDPLSREYQRIVKG